MTVIQLKNEFRVWKLRLVGNKKDFLDILLLYLNNRSNNNKNPV